MWELMIPETVEIIVFAAVLISASLWLALSVRRKRK